MDEQVGARAQGTRQSPRVKRRQGPGAIPGKALGSELPPARSGPLVKEHAEPTAWQQPPQQLAGPVMDGASGRLRETSRRQATSWEAVTPAVKS